MNVYEINYIVTRNRLNKVLVSMSKKDFKMTENSLNTKLIETQMLSENDVEQLIVLHYLKDVMSDISKTITDADDILIFNETLYEMECLAQKHWEFKVNVDFHCWWFHMSGCSCPKIDNSEYIGHEYRIINSECKLHS